MPICLVLHELGHAGPAAEQALFSAVFEVASSHWRVTPGATLVGTDVSPTYLRDHLLRALDDFRRPAGAAAGHAPARRGGVARHPAGRRGVAGGRGGLTAPEPGQPPPRMYRRSGR